jgi:hypothetical protein
MPNAELPLEVAEREREGAGRSRNWSKKGQKMRGFQRIFQVNIIYLIGLTLSREICSLMPHF